LRLRKFRVQAFRCIHDSGDIVVGDLAAFVGRNESGKTTILQALTMLNKDEIISELDLCDEMTERLKSEIRIVEGDFELNHDETEIVKERFPDFHITKLKIFRTNKDPEIQYDFGDIPHKYIMRSGQLAFGTHIKGITKTLEKWKNIYKNADEYIYEILSEIPGDLFDPLTKKVKAGIKSQYIVSEFASVPQGRKAELKKSGFNKLIEKGLIERKMRKYVKVIIVLNEKEACVCFPNLNGEADLTEMFYGDDYQFHEWCLDYFKDCWSDADLFIESLFIE